MATMKDVAKRAGVSLITVSRVVNSSGYVREETRSRVEAVIEELQYVPNALARSLRSRQSDLLALMLPNITNSFWTTIARGVEDEAWTHGYGVFICNTDNDPEKEKAYIQRLIQRRIEGLIVVPTPFRSTELQLERLRNHGIKFVVIHRRLRGTAANTVRSDGEGAARTLTTELVRAGRRHIAFAGLSINNPITQERLKGYQEALRHGRLPLHDELLRFGDKRPDQNGFRIVSDLLQGPITPDAILLANSRVAMGGLRAIEQANLSIPADIMVAAFHDINALDVYAPHLLTAVQPAYRMGQLGTRQLLEMNADDNQFREIILEPSIHVGGRSILEPA